MENNKMTNIKKEDLITILKSLPEGSHYLHEVIEPAIIATGRADLCYEFFVNVKGANIKELEKVIINDSNPQSNKYKISFAQQYRNCDIEGLEKSIIDSEDSRSILMFAWGVRGANIRALEKAIIKTRNIEDIEAFAKYVKGANKELLKQIIDEIKEEDKSEK